MSSRDPEIQRFLKIAKSVASETGQAVLFRLVASLSDYLDAAFVAVTYGEGNPVNHARALYALKNQEAVHDVRYALEGTPCERVNAGEVLTVPCEIAELYPRETGYEGYIGQSATLALKALRAGQVYFSIQFPFAANICSLSGPQAFPPVFPPPPLELSREKSIDHADLGSGPINSKVPTATKRSFAAQFSNVSHADKV